MPLNVNEMSQGKENTRPLMHSKLGNNKQRFAELSIKQALPIVMVILTKMERMLAEQSAMDEVQTTLAFITDTIKKIKEAEEIIDALQHYNLFYIRSAYCKTKNLPAELQMKIDEVRKLPIPSMTVDLWRELATCLEGIYQHIQLRAEQKHSDQLSWQGSILENMTGMNKLQLAEYSHKMANELFLKLDQVAKEDKIVQQDQAKNNSIRVNLQKVNNFFQLQVNIPDNHDGLLSKLLLAVQKVADNRHQALEDEFVELIDIHDKQKEKEHYPDGLLAWFAKYDERTRFGILSASLDRFHLTEQQNFLLKHFRGMIIDSLQACLSSSFGSGFFVKPHTKRLKEIIKQVEADENTASHIRLLFDFWRDIQDQQVEKNLRELLNAAYAIMLESTCYNYVSNCGCLPN